VRARGNAPAAGGLAGLRRAGAATELLFLYECTTREVAQLRPVAHRLGLTVQAVSHVYRQLQQAGRAEFRDGLYRATVPGVAWLHGALGALREDLTERWGRLDVVRSCRAVAATRLAAGRAVALEMRDGVLTARPGSGPSEGRVVASVGRGGLAEVTDLRGIVAVPPGRIRVRTFRDADAAAPATLGAIRRTLRASTGLLLAAFGMEAAHLVARATRQPLVRYGVAAAGSEASSLGVSSLVFVRDADLPRFLAQLDRASPPPIEVRPLSE